MKTFFDPILQKIRRDDIKEAIVPLYLPVGDETTAITASTAKLTFRIPFACSLSSIKASLSTAQISGNIFTVDINKNLTSILSTKLTIDNTEKTNKTAAAPYILTSSDTTFAEDDEITIDVDQIGDSTAKGLKVWLLVKVL